MQAVITDAIFISNSAKDWTNKQTGEVTTFYRALFSQDGSDPLEISIDESLYNVFERFGTYNLDLEITSYQGRMRNKVTGFAQVGTAEVVTVA